jgi:hypothetical protein
MFHLKAIVFIYYKMMSNIGLTLKLKNDIYNIILHFTLNGYSLLQIK